MLTRLRELAHRAAADEQGNTLVLYPFALLIVLGLGSLALDGAVFFQAHREAVDVAAGLATDIAGAIDERAFAGGVLRVDVAAADGMLQRANGDLAGHPNGLRCSARFGATDQEILVRCTGTAEPVLGLGPFGSFSLVGESTASVASR